MSEVLERLRRSAVRPRRKVVLVAIFGLYTRHILQVYLQHVFVVFLGLLIAALTIDVSTQIPEILAAPPHATGLRIPLRLAWYLLLRSADLGTRLLPVGCFLGVLSAEVALTLGRERLMVSNTGRTPYQCIVPALLLGFSLGCVQVVLDTYVRPMAMMAQISGRLGEDGRWHDRTREEGQRWLVSSMGLVKARIEYGPPPVLHDITLFSMGSDGQLNKVLNAESATPEEGTNLWLLRGGSIWLKQGTLNGPTEGEASNSAEARVDLGIDPVWISNLGINPMYLPQKTLKSIANSHNGVLDKSEYRLWVQLRYTDFLLPGGMILLASSMSLLFFRFGSSFQRIVTIALIGYSVHVLLRALNLLCGYGYIPPEIASWSVPCILFLVAMTALATTQALGAGQGLFGELRRLLQEASGWLQPR
jgi:lipopolysaccharide export system permease protein